MLASLDGRDDSLVIHQDAVLSVAELKADNQVRLSLADNRHGYLHVAYGNVQIGDATLVGGDAITFAGSTELEITAGEDSQLLFFDLA